MQDNLYIDRRVFQRDFVILHLTRHSWVYRKSGNRFSGTAGRYDSIEILNSLSVHFDEHSFPSSEHRRWMLRHQGPMPRVTGWCNSENIWLKRMSRRRLGINGCLFLIVSSTPETESRIFPTFSELASENAFEKHRRPNPGLPVSWKQRHPSGSHPQPWSPGRG